MAGFIITRWAKRRLSLFGYYGNQSGNVEVEEHRINQIDRSMKINLDHKCNNKVAP